MACCCFRGTTLPWWVGYKLHSRVHYFWYAKKVLFLPFDFAKKKMYFSGIEVSAVFFNAVDCLGSKFGIPGLKVDAGLEYGFCSVGSGPVGVVGTMKIPGISRFWFVSDFDEIPRIWLQILILREVSGHITYAHFYFRVKCDIGGRVTTGEDDFARLGRTAMSGRNIKPTLKCQFESEPPILP